MKVSGIASVIWYIQILHTATYVINSVQAIGIIK